MKWYHVNATISYLIWWIRRWLEGYQRFETSWMCSSEDGPVDLYDGCKLGWPEDGSLRADLSLDGPAIQFKKRMAVPTNQLGWTSHPIKKNRMATPTNQLRQSSNPIKGTAWRTSHPINFECQNMVDLPNGIVLIGIGHQHWASQDRGRPPSPCY